MLKEFQISSSTLTNAHSIFKITIKHQLLHVMGLIGPPSKAHTMV